MNITLKPGRYYAGITRPWFVSDAAVREALASYGIGQVSFHDRESEPIPVTASDDGWDEWVEAVYSGPPQTIDVTKRWAWLAHVPVPVPPGSEPARPWPQVPLSAYLPIGVRPPNLYQAIG